jgi:hypothetical protein
MGHLKGKRFFWTILTVFIIFVVIMMLKNYTYDVDRSRYKFMKGEGGRIYKIDKVSGDVYLIAPSGMKKLEEEME